MPTFTRVVPGTLIAAQNVNQLIDALDGASGAGVPIAITAVNDPTNYALTIQNDEATNQRALNVLNASGVVQLRVDASGVTLGSPLNLPNGSITSAMIADGTIVATDIADGTITTAKLTGPIDVLNAPLRSSNTGVPSTGSGAELYWDGTESVAQSYNRSSGAYLPLVLIGSTISLRPNGVQALGIDASNNVTMAGALSVAGNVGANSISGPTSISLQTPAVINTTGGVPLYLRPGGGQPVTIDTGPLNVAGAVTAGAFTTAGAVTAPQITLGSGSVPYFLAVSGSVRYAAISPGSHSFEYASGGYAPCVGLAFTPTSARRFKSNIVTLDNPLGLVLDDRVHGVRYIEIATNDPKVGFIAEDWLPVEPSLVAYDMEGAVVGLDYDRINAITFEALKQYVAKTDARLAALEAA